MGRFVVLNSILGIFVGLAYLAGFLESALTGPARWGVAAITINLIAGLVAIACARFELGRFFCSQATALALIGTAYGILETLTALQGMAGSDALVHVLTGAGLAMWSTVCGIASYLWLRAALYVAGQSE